MDHVTATPLLTGPILQEVGAQNTLLASPSSASISSSVRRVRSPPRTVTSTSPSTARTAISALAVSFSTASSLTAFCRHGQMWPRHCLREHTAPQELSYVTPCRGSTRSYFPCGTVPAVTEIEANLRLSSCSLSSVGAKDGIFSFRAAEDNAYVIP